MNIYLAWIIKENSHYAQNWVNGSSFVILWIYLLDFSEIVLTYWKSGVWRKWLGFQEKYTEAVQ